MSAVGSMDMESCRTWLDRNQFGDDNTRAKVVTRLFDLKRIVKVDRDSALGDLNQVGFFHVQPCYCEKCRGSR